MKASRLSSDIISSLPPVIIETILCLLPIQEAVRTSVLSKEWRYTWTKIPKLVFNDFRFKAVTEYYRLSDMEQTFHHLSERHTMSDKCKFFYAIYQVMLLHQGPILEFTLIMDRANDGCVEIDHMITHLSRKNTVTKLMLSLNESYSFRLPLSIFSFQQLTDLTLGYCEIDHQRPSNGFASLTRLCLKNVDITKKRHLDLISSCPELKRFELQATDDGTECFGIDYGAALIELLKCLHVVEELILGLLNVESFAKIVLPRELPALLVHLKYICLERVSIRDKCWLRLVALLMRSSPNLEKIEILTYEIDCFAQEDFSDIWLEHLNEFKIGKFSCMECNLELVKFILAKSPLLKKVRITLTGWTPKDEELKICKTLLRSPRASLLVDIIVKRGSELF